jgi:putative cell wall-binding protein
MKPQVRRRSVLVLVLAVLLVVPANTPLAQEQQGSRVVAWGSGYLPPPNCGTGMGELTAISTRFEHALGLRADGTVVSWATDPYYSTWSGLEIPAGLDSVTAIAAGAGFSLALRRDGTVVAWGGWGTVQPKVPRGLSGVTAIAAGLHGLALKADGTVVTWRPFEEAAAQSGPRDVVAIGAGPDHSLAVRRDGTVVAWGEDHARAATAVPAGLRGVTAVAGGRSHSVALKSDGTVVAWGSGEAARVPAGLIKVIAIAAGEQQTLALRTDGTVVEWGQPTRAPATLSGVKAVAAGWSSNLALTNASPGARPPVDRLMDPDLIWQEDDNFVIDRPVPMSVAVSRATSDTADSVLVARDDVYADALAGGPLAVEVDGPLLLTGSTTLDELVADEIRRLGATEAVLLGGEAALDPSVERALADLGLETRRVGGADRFATAALIAAELGEWNEVFLAEGRHPDPRRGWPDALSGAALAGATASPVLLVERDRIPPITLDALQGVQTATVLGGPAAVSTAVADEVAQHVDTVHRLAGDHRTTTATAIADEAIHRGLTVERAWVTTGWDWPHALVAAPAAGRRGGVVLLTHPRDPSVAVDWIARNRARLSRLHLTGSPSGGVPAEAEERICEVLYR